MEVQSIERKNENKQPPLLYNLAELQNDCSKFFKLSPDETLKHTQELYEKKLVTYPRTDARVLSSAVAKVIERNIAGLRNLGEYREFAQNILERGAHKNIAKSRYVNDKQITDHYAIIPTGQGFGALGSLSSVTKSVYYAIVRRFLCLIHGKKTSPTTGIRNRTKNATPECLRYLKALKRAICLTSRSLISRRAKRRRLSATTPAL